MMELFKYCGKLEGVHYKLNVLNSQLLPCPNEYDDKEDMQEYKRRYEISFPISHVYTEESGIIRLVTIFGTYLRYKDRGVSGTFRSWFFDEPSYLRMLKDFVDGMPVKPYDEKHVIIPRYSSDPMCIDTLNIKAVLQLFYLSGHTDFTPHVSNIQVLNFINCMIQTKCNSRLDASCIVQNKSNGKWYIPYPTLKERLSEDRLSCFLSAYHKGISPEFDDKEELIKIIRAYV